MNDRTISIVKVQHHNNGYYVRIPADVVRQVRIRKGDYIRVSVSVDKRVIKLTKDDTNDIINLDAPARAAPHIQQKPSPTPGHVSILQRILGK